MSFVPTSAQLNERWHRIRPDIREDLEDWQIDTIKSIMSGRDTLCIKSTGGGKSACYQVAAMELPGIALIVTPLISLMEDQASSLYVKNAEKERLPVAALSGSFILDKKGEHRFGKKRDEEAEGPRKIIRGLFLDAVNDQDAANPEYKIIYVTPERLRHGQFIRFAQRANISMIAVDEAHCISLWGYEFRRRYLEISRFVKKLDKRPVIAAFTATATGVIQEDIERFLGMDNPKRFPKYANAHTEKRSNLTFRVNRYQGAGADKKRLDDLKKELRRHPGEKGIIFCSTRNAVNDLYKQLKRIKSLSVTRYYANLDDDKNILEENESKERNLKAFLNREKRVDEKMVMITTTALGMGLDKENVRFVFHYGMSLNLENYYQEAGRAGRDRAPAECTVFYVPSDRPICEALIEKTLENSTLNGEQLNLRREVALERLNKMEEYCLKVPEEKLYDYILNYFSGFQPNVSKGKIRDIQEAFLEEINEIDVLYVNRTKIAQEIRKGVQRGENLKVGKGRASLPVSFAVSGMDIDYLDMMIADAVYTLMKHREKRIYAKAIVELLAGDHSVRILPERKREIENRLRKMMSGKIRIDLSKAMSAGFFYKDQRRPIIEGAFLPLHEETKGFSYNPKHLPPLYEYAEIMNGQFHSFPLKELGVKEAEKLKQNSSFTNLAITHYLLRRIDSMHSTKNRINFDTMIKVIGEVANVDGVVRVERKKRNLMEKALQVLSHLKKEGRISSYSEVQENPEVVEIKLR